MSGCNGSGAKDEARADDETAEPMAWRPRGGRKDEARAEDEGGCRADAWGLACTEACAGSGDGSYTKVLKISETFLKVARSMPSAPPMWAWPAYTAPSV